MAEVLGDALGEGRQVVQVQLVDVAVHLQQQAQRLADAAGGAQQRHLPGHWDVSLENLSPQKHPSAAPWYARNTNPVLWVSSRVQALAVLPSEPVADAMPTEGQPTSRI